MKLTFRTSYTYGKSTIWAACDKSRVLCELVGRPSFTTSELAMLGRMGIEVVIEGDTKKLKPELDKNKMGHDVEAGKITNIVDNNRFDF